MLNENRIDMLFRAAAEATEDAVVDALFSAEDVVGRDGNRRAALG
jgi:D-aminopeptidase